VALREDFLDRALVGAQKVEGGVELVLVDPRVEEPGGPARRRASGRRSPR
jgi:hypothetical protein